MSNFHVDEDKYYICNLFTDQMIIKDIVKTLEEWAPKAYAEDFDNVGLLTGNPSWNCTGVLVTLDTLESVVEEAISKKCNLIVSFHPIVFSGLKKFTGANYVEKALIKAIKNDIAIYAIHTALDNHKEGVNAQIGQQLQLHTTEILIPQKATLKKLTTYVPTRDADALLEKLHQSGAGAIGKYDWCSFSLEGEGRFRGDETSNPSIGSPGEMSSVKEKQLQLLFPKHLENKILKTLFEAHPYEEVAYEMISLDNENKNIGMGLVGFLEQPMDEKVFLNHIKTSMQVSAIRHSTLLNKKIHKVAVLGGSGSFAIKAAKQIKADAFITADLKYHQFFEAEKQLLLLDIGHYESEQFTKNLIYNYLTKKIPNFAVVLSSINTNPINYS